MGKSHSHRSSNRRYRRECGASGCTEYRGIQVGNKILQSSFLSTFLYADVGACIMTCLIYIEAVRTFYHMQVLWTQSVVVSISMGCLPIGPHTQVNLPLVESFSSYVEDSVTGQSWHCSMADDSTNLKDLLPALRMALRMQNYGDIQRLDTHFTWHVERYQDQNKHTGYPNIDHISSSTSRQ